MTIRFLQPWNGYQIGQTASLAAGVEASLKAAGLARDNYVQDGPSKSFLEVTTNSSGGLGKRPVTISSVGGMATSLIGEKITDLFPLPTMRSIADPGNIDFANAWLTAGIALSWVDAQDEMYGKALRLSCDAGITNKTITLPLLPDFRGNYPKALPRMEWRIKVSDWSAVTRVYLYATETVGTSKGMLWVAAAEDGTSQFGAKGPHRAARWDNKFRTLVTTPYTNRTVVGGAVWGDGSPEYTVKSIAITVSTTSAVTIDINRVACPEWERGALITQMDGGYETSREPIFYEFRKRGWPGVVSRVVQDHPEYIPDQYWPEFAAAGWDVAQHMSKNTQPVSAMDVTTDDAALREGIMDYRRFAQSLGVLNAGTRCCSHLQDATPKGTSDGAAILRANGILTSRGLMPDGEFGIDPGAASTNTGDLFANCPTPSGWSPRWGRYNRHFKSAAVGEATEAARDTFAGSNLEKYMARCAAGYDLGWTYFHRTQLYVPGQFPTDGNSGTNFVRDFISCVEGYVASGRLLPISVSQADMLTYERPGDIYLSWDGAWKSRSTGKVAI